jgi:PAS domain S-box-containing protein
MTTSASGGQTTDVAPDRPAERSGTLTDAVIILDPSLHIRSLNSAAERLYGCAAAHAIDKHLRDIIPWTADQAEQARIAEILDLDGHWHGDLEHARTHGGITRVHVSVAMMGEEAGHRAGIVMVSRAARAQHQVVTKVGAARRPGRAEDLTAREREVLGCLMQGLSNRGVADRLDVTVNTVRNHVQRVLYKLDAHSKLEAVVVATRDRLLDPPV